MFAEVALMIFNEEFAIMGVELISPTVIERGGNASFV